MKVVIPSRRRADVLPSRALQLFPNAVVCVAEEERDEYFRVCKNIVTHPDDVTGIGPIRQWINNHFSDELLLQVDDDCYSLGVMVGQRARRISHPDDVMAVTRQVGECAREAGAKIFGFNQALDVRKFSPLKPFSFNSWVGGVIGFVGREVQYDTTLKLRADIDACLSSLLKHRIVFVDLRFSFAQKRFEGKGGNAVNRSSEQHHRELAYLKRKWGSHLIVRQTKTTTRLVVNVER